MTTLYFECLQGGPVCHTNPAWMTLFQQAGICHWTTLWGSPPYRFQPVHSFLARASLHCLTESQPKRSSSRLTKLSLTPLPRTGAEAWKWDAPKWINHSQLLNISMELHVRWLRKLGEGHAEAKPWYADLREKNWHGLCLSERIWCTVPLNICPSLMQKHSLHSRIHSVMIKDNGCW